MGIHIYCKTSFLKIDYSSSYTYYNELREYIMTVFTNFLSDWLNNNTFIEGESFEFYFHKNLQKLIIEINNVKNPDIDEYINILKKYNNELSCFGFYGIIAFICKQDCEAYWSVGNAFDINYLFEQINYYIEEQYLNSISIVKKVFDYSIHEQEPICIA